MLSKHVSGHIGASFIRSLKGDTESSTFPCISGIDKVHLNPLPEGIAKFLEAFELKEGRISYFSGSVCAPQCLDGIAILMAKAFFYAKEHEDKLSKDLGPIIKKIGEFPKDSKPVAADKKIEGISQNGLNDTNLFKDSYFELFAQILHCMIIVYKFSKEGELKQTSSYGSNTIIAKPISFMAIELKAGIKFSILYDRKYTKELEQVPYVNYDQLPKELLPILQGHRSGKEEPQAALKLQSFLEKALALSISHLKAEGKNQADIEKTKKEILKEAEDLSSELKKSENDKVKNLAIYLEAFKGGDYVPPPPAKVEEKKIVVNNPLICITCKNEKDNVFKCDCNKCIRCQDCWNR